jgi:glycosyltransferase involved in cell wall biosynthesis
MSDQDTRIDSPPRLLFVVNVAWFFLSHRLSLAQAARRAGYEVHIAAGAAAPEQVRKIEEAGLRFHPLRLKRSSGNPLHNADLLWQLFSLYRRLRPAIVHHVTIKPVILGTLAARLVGIPAVVNAVSGLGYAFSSTQSSRRLLRRLVGFAYRACLNHARMIVIFQNVDDRDDFRRWSGLKNLSSVLIAGSGVDLNEFRPTPEPALPVRIVLPARMLRDKGLVEFATAMGALRESGVMADGWLAGALDPENPESLTESALRRMEQECGVRWLGHRADVAQLFSDVHIVCLPSYREGLPKALIEACASGRAIVTTDVPGCRQVVEDGVNGLLVPARQAGQLTEALRRLIQDGEMRQRFGEAGRARAEAQFGIERIVTQTLDVYSQLS